MTKKDLLNRYFVDNYPNYKKQPHKYKNLRKEFGVVLLKEKDVEFFISVIGFLNKPYTEKKICAGRGKILPAYAFFNTIWKYSDDPFGTGKRTHKITLFWMPEIITDKRNVEKILTDSRKSFWNTISAYHFKRIFGPEINKYCIYCGELKNEDFKISKYYCKCDKKEINKITKNKYIMV